MHVVNSSCIVLLYGNKGYIELYKVVYIRPNIYSYLVVVEVIQGISRETPGIVNYDKTDNDFLNSLATVRIELFDVKYEVGLNSGG